MPQPPAGHPVPGERRGADGAVVLETDASDAAQPRRQAGRANAYEARTKVSMTSSSASFRGA